MPEINGWTYVKDFFEESEENRWKMFLAKPENRGYSHSYVCNLTISAGKLYGKGYEVQQVDFEKIEKGEYEPGLHSEYELNFSRSLKDIAKDQGIKVWNLGIENYVR
ncbi:MAG: hypothetical protein V5A72_03510, partial [Candidatus Nanohaloarchaea archaeon]